MALARHAVTQLLPHRTLGLMLITLTLVVAPHAPRLPAWISAALLLCVAWRYLVGARSWRLPPRWLLLLITVAASIGVYFTYGTLLGLDAGVATLTAMLGLKLLELRRRRDTVVVLYLGFFLVITQMIYSQSLISMVYMLFTVWAMTMLLITATRPSPNNKPLEHAGLAATILLQAIPIMVLLFVLFPRIPGPLWGMPEHQTRAMTGLSDSMRPGSVGQLSQSDAVAFRVEFDDELPPQRALYWRGPVLPTYDGRTWRQPRETDRFTPVMTGIAGQVDYTVTMEANDMPWIFTLDMPIQVSILVSVDSEYQVRQERAVRERTRYSASSMLNFRLQPELAQSELDQYLHLPDGYHPRTKEMIRRWRSEPGDDTEAFIDRALSHFRDEPFVYTLNPDILRDDAVDQFLFDSRRGFCENFAGAFAVMMRAGGVPARIVTGYQGGELNNNGGYLIVRQSEAHAWTEVHIPGEGWRRLDPTAWVAPDRVEHGLARALQESDQLARFARRDASLLHALNLRWDAVNTYWHRWVLAYGPDLQQRLMERLGLASWPRMAAALGLSLLLVGGLLSLGILYRGNAAPRDPAVVAWQRFCRRLEKVGITRQPHEGPRDFARRAASERPDLAGAIGQVADHYIRVRYARGSQNQRDGQRNLRTLQTAAKAFRAPSR